MINILEDSILATDLAVYFRRRSETFSKMESGTVDWSPSAEHDRSLIRGLMMSACDLGAITKPWKIQKKVAKLVANEFFEQGDLEKRELKLEPIDMMNREKMENLPSMQVGFIDAICLPIYDALAKFSGGKLSQMLDGCLVNKSEWRKLTEAKVNIWDEDEAETTLTN